MKHGIAGRCGESCSRLAAPTPAKRPERVMPPKTDQSQLEQKARFIFQGTVVKTKAATMPQVPVSPRTAVVRVEPDHPGPAGAQAVCRSRDHCRAGQNEQGQGGATSDLLHQWLAVWRGTGRPFDRAETRATRRGCCGRDRIGTGTREGPGRARSEGPDRRGRTSS